MASRPDVLRGPGQGRRREVARSCADLTYFGQFIRHARSGYNVEQLSRTIGEVLGHNRLQPVILVGAGNLGSALLRYGGFRKEGFEFVSAFDLVPDEAKAAALSIRTDGHGQDWLLLCCSIFMRKWPPATVPATGAEGRDQSARRRRRAFRPF